MDNRPKCTNEGCNNPATKKRTRKDGIPVYRKLCSGCLRRKYGMPSNSKGRAKAKLPNKCIICGWDKAPCDIHRIKFGKDGGKYTKGNVVKICPNCHRQIHFGSLSIQ